MKLTATDYALLGLLSIQPMSGYELKQFAGHSVGHFWSESYGQIYPALTRLAKAGYIAQQRPATPAQQQGRERRVFALNRSGREVLEAWVPLPARAQVPRNELLLKLFFGAHAGFKSSREHLREFARAQRAQLKSYAEIEKQLRSSTNPQAPYWRMTLRQGILLTKANLEWAEESLDTLDVLKKAGKRRGKVPLKAQ